MSLQTALLIRHWVLFWVAVPVLADAICFALGQISGNMAFIWPYMTFFVAHVISTAGLVGICSIIFGLRPDWKLLAAIVLGLGAGLFVLGRIYFWKSFQ